jgi:hypothetical protein
MGYCSPAADTLRTLCKNCKGCGARNGRVKLRVKGDVFCVTRHRRIKNLRYEGVDNVIEFGDFNPGEDLVPRAMPDPLPNAIVISAFGVFFCVRLTSARIPFRVHAAQHLIFSAPTSSVFLRPRRGRDMQRKHRDRSDIRPGDPADQGRRAAKFLIDNSRD